MATDSNGKNPYQIYAGEITNPATDPAVRDPLPSGNRPLQRFQASRDKAEDVNLTAQNLAKFLMLAMEMSILRRGLYEEIISIKSKALGIDVNLSELQKTKLREFNPFLESEWNSLEESTGIKLERSTVIKNNGEYETLNESIKDKWYKQRADFAKSAKSISLDALFTRVAEEVVKIVAGRINSQVSRRLSNKMLQNTAMEVINNVLTAHPNGKLHSKLEPYLGALVSGLLSESGFEALKDIGRWNGKEVNMAYLRKFDTTNYLFYDNYYADQFEEDSNGNNIKNVTGYGALVAIWSYHSKPAKMTPAEERARQRQWVSTSYNACSSYMEAFKRQFEPAANTRASFEDCTKQRKTDWGVKRGFASIEELDQIRPPGARSWVIGDADGKNATQPETVKQGIIESRAHPLTLHAEAFQEIMDILDENQGRIHLYHPMHAVLGKARNEIAELKALVEKEIQATELDKMGAHLDANMLARSINEIKTKYEDQNVFFDSLDEAGFPQHSYSKLDVLYVNVRRCGEFFPPVENRQNAEQHHRALSYLGKLLQNEGLGDFANIAEDPEAFITKMQNDEKFSMAVQEIIQAEYARLTEKLNPDGLTLAQLMEMVDVNGKPVPLLSFLRDKAWPEKNEDGTKNEAGQKEMHARQILGFFMLQSQYPSAISSYVIAETAQASPEFKKVNKTTPENILDTDKTDALGEEVVRLGLRDYRQLHAFQLMTGSTKKQVEYSTETSPVTKFIPLFEDPQSIVNQIRVWEAMVHAPDIQGRMLQEAKKVEIYDEGAGAMRPMTVADYKKNHGLAVAEGDEQTFIYEGPEWMDAGSDSAGRGGTLMNIIIALVREEADQILFKRPITVKGERAVLLPRNHAGVGAGDPRSQDKGNTVTSRSVAHTTQGLSNLFNESDQAQKALARQLYIEEIRYGKHQPDPKHFEKSKFPDYIGSGVNTLTKEDKADMLKRCCAVMESRVDMVYSEPYTQHLTNNTHGLLANSMNHSSREATREGEILGDYPALTSYEKLRFIGAVNRMYIAGDCGTETQVLKYFEQDPAKDLKQVNGITMLSDETRKFLIRCHRSADCATNALSGFAVVIPYANYENSWKMAGLTRVRLKNGEYAVKTPDDRRYTIKQLCELYEQYKALEKEEKSKGKELQLPKGIDLGHLALADHDRQFEGMARHTYELYYRMQHGDEKGNLETGKEKALAETLRKFTPKKIYDIMPEHMVAVCKKRKELIDPMRKVITTDHGMRMASNGKDFLFNLETGGGFLQASVHDLLKETGPTPRDKNQLSVRLTQQVAIALG